MTKKLTHITAQEKAQEVAKAFNVPYLALELTLTKKGGVRSFCAYVPTEINKYRLLYYRNGKYKHYPNGKFKLGNTPQFFQATPTNLIILASTFNPFVEAQTNYQWFESIGMTSKFRVNWYEEGGSLKARLGKHDVILTTQRNGTVKYVHRDLSGDKWQGTAHDIAEAKSIGWFFLQSSKFLSVFSEVRPTHHMYLLGYHPDGSERSILDTKIGY